MTLKAASVAATVFLVLIPILCRAQDFSADVAYDSSKQAAPSTGTAGSRQRSSKLYVSKNKMRLETTGLSTTILLVNGETHTTFALFPAQKAYQPLIAGLSEYFRVADLESACGDWQKAADRKFVCEKVGPDVVDGRQTVKYEKKSGSADDSAAIVWIDTALKFVVKWQSAASGAELRNIKEGPQSADLFVLPSGYEPLKPLKKQRQGVPPRPR
jgi:hypothetical protein